MTKQHLRFPAIEGLRGWLAWTVVFNHLSFFTNFGRINPALMIVGSDAVLIFVIVSGFVITHLLLESREPYWVYIVRRWFRLFPLFAVTCFAGYWAYRFQVRVGNVMDAEFRDVLGRVVNSTDAQLWPHILAHASMLHSAVAPAQLPESYFAFSMPAWSTSLEWQFYLVAPLALWLLLRFPVVAALLAFIGWEMARRGYFGYEDLDTAGLRGLLPMMSAYFALGMISRLAYEQLAPRMNEVALSSLIATLIVFYMLGVGRPPIVWAFMFATLLAPLESEVYAAAFLSPMAQYFGSRSYAVYLIHFPVIMFSNAWLQPPSAGALCAIVLPVTFGLADLAHRFIEKPGIALGRRLTKRKTA